MEKAVKAEDASNYHLLNLEFHDRLVEMAGNSKLTAIYRKLIKELSLFRRAEPGRRLAVADIGQRARQIVKAIASGDPDAAGRAMCDHVDGKQGAHDREPPARRAAEAARAGEPSTRRQPMMNVNGRDYRLPHQPMVVVCVDGCEPDYLAQAVADGHVPWLKRSARRRARASSPTAWCPSFTNPNNLSIVTGAPPAVHGICGNYFYDSRPARK